MSGRRSTAPRTTPCVSLVSTSPVTRMVSASTEPPAEKVWRTLPNVSSPRFSRPSALGSILQRSTCPSWSRGVRRRCWMRPRTGRS